MVVCEACARGCARGAGSRLFVGAVLSGRRGRAGSWRQRPGAAAAQGCGATLLRLVARCGVGSASGAVPDGDERWALHILAHTGLGQIPKGFHSLCYSLVGTIWWGPNSSRA